MIYKPKANDAENNDSLPIEKVTRSTFECDERDGSESVDGDELPLVEISSGHRQTEREINNYYLNLCTKYMNVKSCKVFHSLHRQACPSTFHLASRLVQTTVPLAYYNN